MSTIWPDGRHRHEHEYLWPGVVQCCSDTAEARLRACKAVAPDDVKAAPATCTLASGHYGEHMESGRFWLPRPQA